MENLIKFVSENIEKGELCDSLRYLVSKSVSEHLFFGDDYTERGNSLMKMYNDLLDIVYDSSLSVSERIEALVDYKGSSYDFNWKQTFVAYLDKKRSTTPINVVNCKNLQEVLDIFSGLGFSEVENNTPDKKVSSYVLMKKKSLGNVICPYYDITVDKSLSETEIMGKLYISHREYMGKCSLKYINLLGV